MDRPERRSGDVEGRPHDVGDRHGRRHPVAHEDRDERLGDALRPGGRVLLGDRVLLGAVGLRDRSHVEPAPLEDLLSDVRVLPQHRRHHHRLRTGEGIGGDSDSGQEQEILRPLAWPHGHERDALATALSAFIRVLRDESGRES